MRLPKAGSFNFSMTRWCRQCIRSLRCLSSVSCIPLTITALLASASLHADVKQSLIVAVPNAIPPYAIKHLNRGIEIDVVRAALNHQGYDFSPEYVPLGRLNHTLTSGQVDGAITIKENLITARPIYFSDEPHIYYQNVAITLAQRGFSFQQLSQLQDYSIAVFQTPDQFIGPEWVAMRKRNQQPIFEVANQKNQVKMLYARRVDTLVMDINIFHYYRNQLPPTPDMPIAVHDILPRNYVKVAFTSAAVTEAFNQGLAAIKANGNYQAILNRYQEELQRYQRME